MELFRQTIQSFMRRVRKVPSPSQVQMEQAAFPENLEPLQEPASNAPNNNNLQDQKAVSLFELFAAANRLDAKGIGQSAGGEFVLMIVISDLRIDPRVEREARALALGGYRVEVVAPDPTSGKDTSLRLDWGPGVTITFITWHASQCWGQRPGYHAGLLFKSALALAEAKAPLALHAHDLSTCLAGIAIAHLTGAHLIADFHEWTSENVHWHAVSQSWQPYPREWKMDLQALEARVMREASEVITVCDSIADDLAIELGESRRATVIRNIPSISLQPTRQYPSLKKQLGLPEQQFVLLWQGGTGPTRLIEPIITALADAPECVFVIRGPSLDLFGDGYRDVAERAGVTDRLIMLGPVPSRDVVAAARGADAGIWTLPRLCRNFTYALPNKVFEYIASGLALLVADYPEARRLVEQNNLGATFDPYNPKSIARAINQLIDDPVFARLCRANTVSVRDRLDADGEWKKLVALYDGLARTATSTY